MSPFSGPAAAAHAFVCLKGEGVHGGKPGRLEIRLRAEGFPGPLFEFPGFPGPLSPDDLARLPRAARRATVLGPLPIAGPEAGMADPAAAAAGNAAGPAAAAPAAGGGNLDATVETPEHLLAALLFFADAPLSLRSGAAELPGLDGSALPFRDALSRLVPAAARVPAWRDYPCDLSWEDEWAGGRLSIRPHARFRVRYELDRGPLKQAFVLEDAATAWNGILPARTFAFHSEWRDARAAGLMAGAGRDSGLLLAASEAEHRELSEAHPDWESGPYPLLNQGAWRMPDEPVKHKILDLLGDLALNGLALPRASIEVRNGGHSAHHRLLARLREC